MVALAKQKRHVPANVWRAARALYGSDPTLTLQRVAERFDLSLAAVRKRSSRERWRVQERAEATPEGQSAKISEVVRVVTLGDFRKAVQEEAVALLCLLRQARQTAEHDPLEAIRALAPTLERLGRIAENAFEPAPPEYGLGGTHGLLHPCVWNGEAGLPPRAVGGDEEMG